MSSSNTNPVSLGTLSSLKQSQQAVGQIQNKINDFIKNISQFASTGSFNGNNVLHPTQSVEIKSPTVATASKSLETIPGTVQTKMGFISQSISTPNMLSALASLRTSVLTSALDAKEGRLEVDVGTLAKSASSANISQVTNDLQAFLQGAAALTDNFQNVIAQSSELLKIDTIFAKTTAGLGSNVISPLFASGSNTGEISKAYAAFIQAGETPGKALGDSFNALLSKTHL